MKDIYLSSLELCAEIVFSVCASILLPACIQTSSLSRTRYIEAPPPSPPLYFYSKALSLYSSHNFIKAREHNGFIIFFLLFQAKLETKALKAKRPGFTDDRYNETSYYMENGECFKVKSSNLISR